MAEKQRAKKSAMLPAKQSRQTLNAGKFVLLLIVFFAALFFVSSLFPKNFFEKATAQSANAVYAATGISGTVQETDNEVFIEIKNGPKIIFNELCTGLLEAILLVAAIAATFEISWKKRLFGIIVGLACVFAFNLFRILVTTLAILNASIETAEFTHNVLFRVFLFIAVAGLYAGWYRWATRG